MGGIGSGKTVDGSHFMLERLAEPWRKNEIGCIYAPTTNQLEQMTLVEFKKVLESKGLYQDEHYVVGVNPKRMFGYESKFPKNHHGVYSFAWGHQIKTFSLESFYRGATYGYGWGDEIQETTNEDITTVLGRMRGGSDPKTFWTLTPPRGNPDIDELIWGENAIPVTFGTTYDNKANLPKGFIEGLEQRMDKYTFAREVMCERVTLTGFNWLYMFDKNKHVSTDAVYQENAAIPVYVSFDFNVNPFVCVLAHRGVRNNKPYIHIFDTIILNPEMIAKGGEYIDAITKEIKARTPAHAKFNSYYITGDASGHSRNVISKVGQTVWTQIVQSFGIAAAQLNVANVNPTHMDSRVLCNAIFDKHPEVKIHPKLKALIRDCEMVMAKDNGSIVKENRRDISQQADLLDALRYLLHAWDRDFIRWRK